MNVIITKTGYKMELDKSIKRLSYTIKNQNKPNNADKEALNWVIEYVNKERNRDITNNNLFSKLYTNAFKNDLIRSDGNYHLVVDNLRSVCRISLDSHLEGLIMEVNQIFLDKELKDIDNIDLEKFVYPKYNNEKMKSKFLVMISKLLEDFN